MQQSAAGYSAGSGDTRPPRHSPHLLEFEEVADRIRCSRSHIFVLTSTKVHDPIPTVRIGRKRLVRPVDLEAWIARQVNAA